MDVTILRRIGFTKGEVAVYLSLLELGNTSTGKLIAQSKVSRSKVYEILDRLKDKGFVTESIKDHRRHFQAASPRKIEDYIERQKRELLAQRAEFETILPQLLMLQEEKEESQQVKIFVGYESIKSYYEEMVVSLGKGEYLGFAFTQNVRNHMPLLLLFHHFHKQRMAKGLKSKILTYVGDPLLRGRDQHRLIYEFRATVKPTLQNVSVFKDRVVHFYWGRTPKIFVIIDASTAESYRRFFDDLWKGAKKL